MGGSSRWRTQVGIVGAGPAGLLLSQLLHLRGIESVIVESRSREAIEATIRAGVLEQGTVDLMTEIGAGDRLKREGFVHHGFEIRFEGRNHRINLQELANGRVITVYAQHEVLKDLIKLRLETGGQIHFEAKVEGVDDVTGDQPKIRFTTKDGKQDELACDFVAGCDGCHGVVPASDSGRHRPQGLFPRLSRRLVRHPGQGAAVLGRADLRPSRARLRAGQHALAQRAAALLPVRPQRQGRELVRRPDLGRAACAASRATASGSRKGEIFQKGIIPLRSFVCEPMQHGRLFLAGDAAHSVPPTGAKGLNLAAADVHVLARAIGAYYSAHSTDLLEDYTATALRRVWRAQCFSWYMTQLLHRFPTPATST